MTLEVLTADTLGDVRHGFFTRKGGASSGIFAGLNCGPGSSDQGEMVRINRARAAGHLGATANALYSLHQHHSTDVVLVGRDDDWTPRPKGDAMVTDVPGRVLGILTADCAPILFRAPGVIGAAHAGWKGAIGGIADATIDAMVALGADRDLIDAVIGPTISQRAYEVGPEFVDRFIDEDPDHHRFFAGGAGDRAMFDLPGFLIHRLRSAGIAQVEWTGHCTYSDPRRFYSYRRSVHAKEADYGRLLSAIRL